jgi:hypothetical protein
MGDCSTCASGCFLAISHWCAKLVGFLSILSIKRGNWFYWADRAERADRAESKEFPVFMRI